MGSSRVVAVRRGTCRRQARNVTSGSSPFVSFIARRRLPPARSPSKSLAMLAHCVSLKRSGYRERSTSVRSRASPVLCSGPAGAAGVAGAGVGGVAGGVEGAGAWAWAATGSTVAAAAIIFRNPRRSRSRGDGACDMLPPFGTVTAVGRHGASRREHGRVVHVPALWNGGSSHGVAGEGSRVRRACSHQFRPPALHGHAGRAARPGGARRGGHRAAGGGGAHAAARLRPRRSARLRARLGSRLRGVHAHARGSGRAF